MPTETEKQDKASETPKGKNKKAAKKSSAKAKGKKTIVMGTAFTHPDANSQGETGLEKLYGRRIATNEEACKGEHPTTNRPIFLGMAMLPGSASPSRLGFESLRPEACEPQMNAAAEATRANMGAGPQRKSRPARRRAAPKRRDKIAA